MITGEALELVSYEVGVPIYQLEDWCDKALAGMEEALKVNAQDVEYVAKVIDSTH